MLGPVSYLTEPAGKIKGRSHNSVNQTLALKGIHIKQLFFFFLFPFFNLCPSIYFFIFLFVMRCFAISKQRNIIFLFSVGEGEESRDERSRILWASKSGLK